MSKVKPGVELWINTPESGMWKVLDLEGYDLSKPAARADLLEELITCLRDHTSEAAV